MLKQLISTLITLILVVVYYLMDNSSLLMNEDVAPAVKYQGSGSKSPIVAPNIMEDYIESLQDEYPDQSFKTIGGFNGGDKTFTKSYSKHTPSKHTPSKHIQTSKNTIYGNAFDLTRDEAELKHRVLEGSEPFPFKNRIQTLDEIKQKFINLHNHKARFLEKQFKIANFKLPRNKEYTAPVFLLSNVGELFSLNPQLYERGTNIINQSKTAYVTIPVPLSAYEAKNDISDYFNEEVRMSCMRSDQEMSSLEFWQRNPQRILDYCFKHYHEITLYALRETMFELWYECTTFKPSCMVDFIQLFGAKSVLDISAGWGDRLIAALSQGVKYVGVDPNTRLFPGYAKIVEFARGVIAKANLPNWKFVQPALICAPFETAKLPDGQFDMVFSSPPFFDLEKYSDEPTQSMHGKKNIKEWYDGFLRVVVTKAWGKLKLGGHLVLYINDVKNRDPFIYNLLQDMNIWVETAESKALYLGCVVQYNAATYGSGFYSKPESKFDEFVNTDFTNGAKQSSVEYYRPKHRQQEVVQGQPFWIWRKVGV